MSDSTTLLDLIPSNTASPDVPANELFDAASPATLFGRRDETTAALTWGYYGGRIMIGGTSTAIANGTIALSASNTNYVEADESGNVTKNTSAFTAGRTPLYTVVTGSSSVSSYTDHRTMALPSSFRERVIALANGNSSNTLNWNLGGLATVTVTGSSCAISHSNLPNGTLGTMVLEVTNGGLGVIGTLLSGVKWPGGTAPTLTTPVGTPLVNTCDVIVLHCHDGSTVRGSLVEADSR